MAPAGIDVNTKTLWQNTGHGVQAIINKYSAHCPLRNIHISLTRARAHTHTHTNVLPYLKTKSSVPSFSNYFFHNSCRMFSFCGANVLMPASRCFCIAFRSFSLVGLHFKDDNALSTGAVVADSMRQLAVWMVVQKMLHFRDNCLHKFKWWMHHFQFDAQSNNIPKKWE